MTLSPMDRVRDFIVSNFLFGDASRAPLASQSLIENDIIDSTGVLELVAFLEETFNITVSDSDIVPANLDSLDKIAAYVASKSPASAMGAA